MPNREPTQKIEDSKRVGYYRLLTDQHNDWMLGAVLVTDDIGKPEEFKVTYPVRPTLIQRQLYGHSLITHVGIELCGKPLFHDLNTKPQLLLINDERFLLLADDDDIVCPVAFMERAGESISLNTPSQKLMANRQTIQPSTARFQPVTVAYPPNYRQEQIRDTANLIDYFFSAFDLIEPFNRIEVAIQALREQDQKFK